MKRRQITCGPPNVGAIRWIEQPETLTPLLGSTVLLQVAQGVIRRHCFMPERRARNEHIDRGIGPGETPTGVVLGMPPFMQPQCWSIAVNTDGVGEGIVIVSAENAAGKNRVANARQCAKRVPPPPANPFIGHQ